MPRTSTPPLGLTRDQLAAFLDTHEQIKAFENLFAIVEDIAPDVVAQALIAAGSAQATAVQVEGALESAAQDAAINAAVTEAKATQAVGAVAAAVQELATTAAAAQAQATQALQALTAMQQQIDLLASAPPPREFKRSRYGQFLDTTTQLGTVINTAKAITYNTTDLSVGVRLRSPSTSEIQVDTEGVYDFQFSIQLDKSSGGAALFYIWPRVNGFDVANSASLIQIQGNNHEIFSAANFFLDLKALDYVEFMFAVSDLSVELKNFAATAFAPAIPSIIVTVSNNIEGVQ